MEEQKELMDRIELKEYAQGRVKGRRVELYKGLIFLFIISLTTSRITYLFDADTIVDSQVFDVLKIAAILLLILTLITEPIRIGVIDMLMDFDKSDSANISLVFKPLKKIIKIFVLTIFTAVVIMLGTLALIVPGIILTFSFAAIPYIFSDNKDLGIIEVMNLSRKIMKGYKLDYFILNLSFLGWLILSVLTCGILSIWLLPYIEFTSAKFFLDIKEKYYEENNIIAQNTSF